MNILLLWGLIWDFRVKCIQRLPVAIHERVREFFTFHHKLFNSSVFKWRFGSSRGSFSWYLARAEKLDSLPFPDFDIF